MPPFPGVRATTALVIVLTAIQSVVVPVFAAAPYCLPGDACFPTDAELDAFNGTVNGALLKSVPYGAPCYEDTYNAAECKTLAEMKGNEDWRRNLSGIYLICPSTSINPAGARCMHACPSWVSDRQHVTDADQKPLRSWDDVSQLGTGRPAGREGRLSCPESESRWVPSWPGWQQVLLGRAAVLHGQGRQRRRYLKVCQVRCET